MFFDDPAAAFSNLRRALRPDGRLGFVFWQPATANDWLLLPAAIATRIVGVPLPDFDSPAPGPFAFSDRERVRRILTDAGFRGVEITDRNDELLIPEGDVDDFVDGTVKGGHGVAEVLRDATPATREQVRSELDAALRATVRDGQARLGRGGYVAFAVA